MKIPHSDEEFIEMYDSDIEFDEYVNQLFCEGEYGRHVDSWRGEDHRWQYEQNEVYEICGRYFLCQYMCALTELQDTTYYESPFEVEKFEREVTRIETDWVEKPKTTPSN